MQIASDVTQTDTVDCWFYIITHEDSRRTKVQVSPWGLDRYPDPRAQAEAIALRQAEHNFTQGVGIE